MNEIQQAAANLAQARKMAAHFERLQNKFRGSNRRAFGEASKRYWTWMHEVLAAERELIDAVMDTFQPSEEQQTELLMREVIEASMKAHGLTGTIEFHQAGE